MTIHPVGPELFHAYGRTYTRKPIVACRNFANEPEIEWELIKRLNVAQLFQRTTTACQHKSRTSWRIPPISAHTTVIRYCSSVNRCQRTVRFLPRRSLHSWKDATNTWISSEFFFPWRNSPIEGQGLITVEDSRSYSRHTTLGRTPLDEWSVRRRDLYLTTHNIHDRQTSKPGRDSNPQSQEESVRRPTP